MQEGHIAASKLFVTGGNAPEMLDTREEAPPVAGAARMGWHSTRYCERMQQ